jgi:RNA polymerase sigma-70 factor (ECF subfamily)
LHGFPDNEHVLSGFVPIAGVSAPRTIRSFAGAVSPHDTASAPGGSLVDLGRLAQAGSAVALDRLLHRVEGPVYRFLVARVRAAPDAEDLALDLCQEALIRAAGSLGRCTFASDGRLLAWMLTIARNVLLDHVRQARGRGEVRGDPLWGRAAAPGSPGDDPPAPRLLESLAAEALAEVPETTAELLRLRLVSGRSWKEVGDALGIAETAAKRRFQRAQTTLRRRILARVDALPADARRAARRRLLPPDGAAPRSPAGDEAAGGTPRYAPDRP